MTRRRWVYIDGQAYEYGQQPETETHHVMADIEPFMSPDGVYITSRSQWREHLKRTGSIEMGHADIKAAQREWGKKQDAQRERLRGQVAKVAEFNTDGPMAPVERSGLAVEMANRLHGRPMPERKEMIKLSLEISKRMNRGR